MIPTGGGIALIGLLLTIVEPNPWGPYTFGAGMILVLFSWIDRYLAHHYPETEEP